MRTYEVELKYVSYTTITVEARDQNEAEEIAWQELASDGSYRSDYGDWQLESIEEVEGEDKC